MKSKRYRIYKHLAWGVTFGDIYDSSLRLSYSENDAWFVCAFKLNLVNKTYEGFVIGERIRERARKLGGGVCRVRVTHQQVSEDEEGS